MLDEIIREHHFRRRPSTLSIGARARQPIFKCCACTRWEVGAKGAFWLNRVMRRRRAMLRVLGTKVDMVNEDQMV